MTLQYWVSRFKYFHVKPWNGGAIQASFASGAGFGIEFLNDDRTPMELVVRVLQRCFGMRRHDAARTMLKIHTDGSAIVGYAAKDTAEQLVAHVAAEARKHGFQLQCRVTTAQLIIPPDAAR